MSWEPIDTAPIDGRPVWVRGWNWGQPERGQHFGWAYFHDKKWRWAESERGDATYLTEWMPRA